MNSASKMYLANRKICERESKDGSIITVLHGQDYSDANSLAEEARTAIPEILEGLRITKANLEMSQQAEGPVARQSERETLALIQELEGDLDINRGIIRKWKMGKVERAGR